MQISHKAADFQEHSSEDNIRTAGAGHATVNSLQYQAQDRIAEAGTREQKTGKRIEGEKQGDCVHNYESA